MQNADDEQSEEVLIELDTKKNTFTIANKGKSCNPFRIGGIKSLMLPNFSPKKAKKYIGNKGLGFRSIINWSNKIVINSQNLDIIFSKEIAIDFYNSLYNNKQNRNNSVHIAFLCIPKVVENIQNEWTTTITIHYKNDKIEDIKKQLNDIKDEVLLFVNNINKLSIIVDNQEKTVERIKDENKIYLNGILWDIYENDHKNDDALLPKDFWEKTHEKEYYELKIAIKEEFDNKNNLLYSYFPTEINIDFPFIIHGTFDLDSSRNSLNDSDKNRYILGKLVDLIIKTAKTITKNEISYRALEFLVHNSENTRLEKLNFYEKIDEKIDKLEIFPCLDNQFRKKDDVVFVNDEFSKFIEIIEMQDLFPNMLKNSYNSTIELDEDEFESIDTSSINVLSRKIVNIDDRVELIYLMFRYFNNDIFELFVDENDVSISKNEEVYTPKFSNMENLVLPKYLKNNMKFLSKELGDKLLEKFDIKDKKSYRVLIDKLSNITNLKEYETATILERIIAEAKKINTIDATKEMIYSLYENFKINEISITTKIIPCISKSNEIINSNNLFLSKSYPSGKLTENLFGNIFQDNQFLADMEIFNFNENEDHEQIERFFLLLLGVNKYTKFSNIKFDNNYQKFIFTKIDKPLNFKDPVFEFLKIEHLEEILQYCKENNDYEKFILWLLLDENIQEEITSKKSLQYFYRTKHFLSNAPSYVLFQLNNSNIFTDYLITSEKISQLVNDITIDFSANTFKIYDINKADIESLILKIGAVDKIENLSIHRVRKILQNLSIKSPDGKLTQLIYRDIRNHNDRLNDTSIKLCAKEHDNLDYYNQDEIFYVSTTKLPKKIINNIPILNVPPRLGNIIDFFGITDTKNIRIDIVNFNLNNNLTNLFKDFFEKIKPYILAYRFEGSKDKKTKETALNKINKTDIFLCSDVAYKINDIQYELENNDYIESDKKYYIKVSNADFNNIRKTLDFRETFADIIGSIFNITNVDKFIRLISDNIDETDEIIKRTLGHEALNETREYLDIADEFSSFWRTVYKLKNKFYNEKYNKIFIDNIKEDFNLETNIHNIDYTNLKSYESCENLQKLFNELNLKIEDFNKQDPFYKLDFTEYHRSRLYNCFHRHFAMFEKILYKWCKDNSEEEKFLDLIGQYENADKNVNDNIIELDYDAIVKNFINNEFEFTLDDIPTDINYNNIREINEQNIDFEKLITNSDKSLLYFNDKIDEIKKIIADINDGSKTININSIKDKGIPRNINENPTLGSPPEPKNTNPINGGYGTHNPNTDKEKKDKGNMAEQCVYNWLVNQHGESKVKWFSKESDSGHYDLRYEVNDNKWRYVEVKTYSGEMFYLSKPEKIFAEEEKEQYEIFLVEFSANKKCKDAQIIILNNVDFSDATKFRLASNKYEVYYKVNNNKPINK